MSEPHPRGLSFSTWPPGAFKRLTLIAESFLQSSGPLTQDGIVRLRNIVRRTELPDAPDADVETLLQDVLDGLHIPQPVIPSTSTSPPPAGGSNTQPNSSPRRSPANQQQAGPRPTAPGLADIHAASPRHPMATSAVARITATQLVALDTDLGDTKADVIESLVQLVADDGRADAEGLARGVMEREGKAATGLPGGFAIPHCRSAAVTRTSLAFARLSKPVDFGARDGPADLVFLIADAEGGDADHLKWLTQLARALVKKEFLASLRAASSTEEIVALLATVTEPAHTAAPVVVAATPVTPGVATPPAERHLIVAVTAFPTGIAHRFMAADHLINAGKEIGVDVQVETQGSFDNTPLPRAVIRNASAVIFAADVGIRNRERFAGLPAIETGMKRAINEPRVVLQEALAVAKSPNARRAEEPSLESWWSSKWRALGRRV